MKSVVYINVLLLLVSCVLGQWAVVASAENENSVSVKNNVKFSAPLYSCDAQNQCSAEDYYCNSDHECTACSYPNSWDSAQKICISNTYEESDKKWITWLIIALCLAVVVGFLIVASLPFCCSRCHGCIYYRGSMKELQRPARAAQVGQNNLGYDADGNRIAFGPSGLIMYPVGRVENQGADLPPPYWSIADETSPVSKNPAQNNGAVGANVLHSNFISNSNFAGRNDPV